MELYSEKDIKLIDEKLDDVIEKIENKKLEQFEPTIKEIMEINKIVMNYIKEKKRKIYGGYAQNETIVLKNPEDAFYKENNIPDIDMYSPEPLADLVSLSDTLHNKGFKYVQGKEAQHKETYSIFVNFVNVCDISYVPRNIYNRIPFIKIKDINFVHPHFTFIDMYKILTEPYFSSFRWKKILPRLYKLQKHYPFKKYKEPLNSAYDCPAKIKNDVAKINNKILDSVVNSDRFIVVGQYAYNYFLEKAKLNYSFITHPFMQLILTNYVQDAAKIILYLKDNFNDITFVEYYPFWSFTGYSTVIYYKNHPVLHMTSHNDRCTPYLKVPRKEIVSNKKLKDVKGKNLLIGTFDLTLLMNMISGFRARVNQIREKEKYHEIFTSQLIEMRNKYLKDNKKSLMEDTLFRSFLADCIGSTKDPTRETLLSRSKKYEKGKMPIFKYDPSNPKPAPDYRFFNTSGNSIKKSVNFKVTKYVEDPKLL